MNKFVQHLLKQSKLVLVAVAVGILIFSFLKGLHYLIDMCVEGFGGFSYFAAAWLLTWVSLDYARSLIKSK